MKGSHYKHDQKNIEVLLSLVHEIPWLFYDDGRPSQPLYLRGEVHVQDLFRVQIYLDEVFKLRPACGFWREIYHCGKS